MRSDITERKSLRLKVFDGAEGVSKAAADQIVSALKRKPDLLLCASAGGTPTGTYARLARTSEEKPWLFARMRLVQIDEWGGLNAESPVTCRADLQRKLLDPLGIRGKRFRGFRTEAADAEAECERMANWLHENGPVDICILGLGLNGHIAMNEPAQELIPEVHVARLSPSSMQHQMLSGLSKKPRYGLTLGMYDILNSREILLLVSGRRKRSVMKRLMESRVTAAFPASFLRLHANVKVLCDREAAGDPKRWEIDK